MMMHMGCSAQDLVQDKYLMHISYLDTQEEGGAIGHGTGIGVGREQEVGNRWGHARTHTHARTHARTELVELLLITGQTEKEEEQK